MGMAPFPTLWQCCQCRSYITVDAEKGRNFRAPNHLVEIWCAGCKTWGTPIAPNGRGCC